MKNAAIKFVASVVNFEPEKFKGKPVTMSSSTLYGHVIDRVNRNQDLLSDVARYKSDGRLLNAYGQAVIDSFLLGDTLSYTNALTIEKTLELYKGLKGLSAISELETRLKAFKATSLEGQNGKPNEYQFFIEGHGDVLIKPNDIISEICRLQVDGTIRASMMNKKFTVVNYNTSVRVKVNFSSPATITADLMGFATFIKIIDAS